MLRVTLRNLLAHKVRLLLSTLAIVLGIAFLSGVLTFNTGMQSTFDGIIKGSTSDGLVRAEGAESFSDAGSGTTTSTLQPAVVDRLRALPEVADAEGLVDGFGMNLLDSEGKLVGGQGAPTLAFNHTDLHNVLGEPTLQLATGEWPDDAREITVDVATAEKAGYRLGDEVRVVSPTGELAQTLTLVGTADFNGGGTAGATLVTFSTHGAQQFFLGGRDVFTSIGLTAADGVSQVELTEAAGEVLPEGYTAVTGDTVIEESQSAVGEFLGIITTFLLVFAIVAIIVGAFIIVNTFAILVAQRVRELALLRAMGASRRQVTRSVLLEAVVMSLVASGIGVVAGWLLALGLATLFTSFGLTIRAEALDITGTTVLTCVVVGLVVTTASAYFPARRAAAVPPVAAMRDEALADERTLRRRVLLGVVALVVGAGVVAAGVVGAPGEDAIWAGVGAAIWIVTIAVISPVVGRPVLRACRAVYTALFGRTGQLAGDNALRDPRRTGATASALMIGLALVSTIGVLATSMNTSIDDIVEENFASDFLVQSQTFQPFPVSIADRMRDVDGVGVVSQQQGVRATVAGDETFVMAQDRYYDDIYSLDVLEGTDEIRGNQSLITDQAAAEYGVEVGDPLEIAFASGATRETTVAGIFAANGYVASNVNVPLSLLEDLGIQRLDNSVSIDLAPGADASTVKQDLEKVVANVPVVPVQDREEFADSIRGQVDQLLYIVYGLLALAIVIAVVGIVNTLSLSVLERTREIGLLRAIGLSRRRLRRMVTLESVAIALLGAVLGLGLGLAIGTLLRWVFREDVTSLALPTGQLVLFLGIAVVVGVLAAVVPAARAARMNVLSAIATE